MNASASIGLDGILAGKRPNAPIIQQNKRLRLLGSALEYLERSTAITGQGPFGESGIRRTKLDKSCKKEFPWVLQVSCVLLSVALWGALILVSSGLTNWFGVSMGLSHGDCVIEQSGEDHQLIHRTLWATSGDAILPLWTIPAVLTVMINFIPLRVYQSRWRQYRQRGLCCGRCDGELDLNNVAKYEEVFLCNNCAKQMEDMEEVTLTRFAMITPTIAPPPSP